MTKTLINRIAYHLGFVPVAMLDEAEAKAQALYHSHAEAHKDSVEARIEAVRFGRREKRLIEDLDQARAAYARASTDLREHQAREWRNFCKTENYRAKAEAQIAELKKQISAAEEATE